MAFYKLFAYFVKYFTNTRYSYYLKIKNKNIIVKSRIKYSNSKILLNIGDFIQYYMFMDGSYEVETLGFVASIIDDKVFFDVGANIGSYSLSLHRKAKQIYAFEASRNNINSLNENIKANKIDNIKTINKAVSSEDNISIKVYLSPDASGNHSIYNKFTGKYEYVETVALASFFKKNNMEEIDIIKIDVEGAEFDVIRGANQLLQKFKPLLIVEFNSSGAKVAGFRLCDLYLHLESLGYKSFILKKGLLSDININEIDNDDQFQQNIIFVHRKNWSFIPSRMFNNEICYRQLTNPYHPTC